jgi:hypothetical protein
LAPFNSIQTVLIPSDFNFSPKSFAILSPLPVWLP